MDNAPSFFLLTRLSLSDINAITATALGRGEQARGLQMSDNLKVFIVVALLSPIAVSLGATLGVALFWIVVSIGAVL